MFKEPVKPIADTIKIEELYEIGNSIQIPYLRSAFFIMYLTGARIGELIKISKRDIELTEDNTLVIKLITEKNKSHPIRSIPIICYDNPKHSQFNDIERKMCLDILTYIESNKPDELLFDMSRFDAYHKFVRNFETTVRYKLGNNVMDSMIKRINPHYLRHCRLTHLRQEYGYDAISLMQFAGWSNTNPAATYLHIGYKDLSNEMLK
jgi:integrase